MVQAFLLTDSLEKVRDQKRCNESSPVAEVGMENRSQPSGLLIGKNKNKELQTSLFARSLDIYLDSIMAHPDYFLPTATKMCHMH